jgi:hypothetical protein
MIGHSTASGLVSGMRRGPWAQAASAQTAVTNPVIVATAISDRRGKGVSVPTLPKEGP